MAEDSAAQMPIFETDDQNMHFLVTLPIHKAFIDEKAYIASLGKEVEENRDAENVKGTNFLKGFLKGFLKENVDKITERQVLILWAISTDDTLTAKGISQKISSKTSGEVSVSDRTIRTDISILQKLNFLYREGGRKDGRWIITMK